MDSKSYLNCTLSTIIKHWRAISKMKATEKNDETFPIDRFKWLSTYRDTLLPRWENTAMVSVPWTDKAYEGNKQKILYSFLYNSLNRIPEVIKELSLLLPNKENVNNILPVLIVAYIARIQPRSAEHNSSFSSIYIDLKFANNELIPPSECMKYAKIFKPLKLNHNGLKSKKFEALLESQPLFRQALYLDIFLNALVEGYQMNICDIYASVEIFEKDSQLLNLYFEYELEDLMSLSEADLYNKLKDALDNTFCNWYSYLKFAHNLLKRLCEQEAQAKFDDYTQNFNAHFWFPLDPEPISDSYDESIGKDIPFDLLALLKDQSNDINLIIDWLSDKPYIIDPADYSETVENSVPIIKELDNLIAKSNDLKKVIRALKSSRADGQMGKDKS